MAEGTREDLSPWSSGKWGFDPQQIGLVAPGSRKLPGDETKKGIKARKSAVSHRSSKFGRLPEEEIWRLGSLFLFAASGFALAVIAILIMA